MPFVFKCAFYLLLYIPLHFLDSYYESRKRQDYFDRMKKKVNKLTFFHPLKFECFWYLFFALESENSFEIGRKLDSTSKKYI